MIELDAATFCLQWATGGLLFLWVTTRRREVGIGYGWMMRISFGLIAALGVFLGVMWDDVSLREVVGVGVVVATGVALVVSVQRRAAGVALERERVERKSKRITEMTGIDRATKTFDTSIPEFPPQLDLIAPIIGFVGLVVAADLAGGPYFLALARIVAGALFLGAVTDAMLLGHWYLVQPGLSRAPLWELVRWTGWLWPVEVAVMLIPTGMVSVFTGAVDDGYGGILGWMWLTCAVTTIGLVLVTRAALKERYYSAVMAATGLLYLAILTAFGMDLVARAVLS